MEPENSEEYSLCWEGHIQHVKKVFNKLLQSSELCDVTLYAEGRRIGAHKVFLSACSGYFNQLFNDFKDERPVVVLKGIQFDILKHILSFVYNGEASIEVERLNQFLEAAAFLKIHGLTKNNIKRKRTSSLVSDSDNVSVGYEQTSKAGTQEQQGLTPRVSTENFGLFKSQRPPKLSRFDNRANKKQLDGDVSPNFAKPPELGKYPMDTPERVGEWLSDYEFNSQSSTVQTQLQLEENTDNPPLEKSTDDSLEENTNDSNNLPLNFNETNIKIETDNYTQEIPSFNQNDFANSLDAEIEISDDHEDILEKELMKTSLASTDEQGLYQCQICNKSYVKKDSLKKHFAVHVNNTTCIICGKVLSRMSHLARHLRIHKIR